MDRILITCLFLYMGVFYTVPALVFLLQFAVSVVPGRKQLLMFVFCLVLYILCGYSAKSGFENDIKRNSTSIA